MFRFLGIARSALFRVDDGRGHTRLGERVLPSSSCGIYACLEERISCPDRPENRDGGSGESFFRKEFRYLE